MKALISACRANDVTDFIVLHEHRGEPGMVIHFRLKIMMKMCKLLPIVKYVRNLSLPIAMVLVDHFFVMNRSEAMTCM